MFLFLETTNVAKIQNVYEEHLKFIRADKRLENWPSFLDISLLHNSDETRAIAVVAG